MDIITLEQKGQHMNFIPEKKLGFGLMRLPQNSPDAADIDLEQVKKMVDLFLEKGFTYFDTAWMYNGFASESAVKEVLTSRHPRESFTLATKLHAGFIHSFEDRDRIFRTQLEKTGAGYFDYYLLHGIEAGMLPTYEKYNCFSWLLEKKEQGLVKHAGFSFHDQPELLDQILTEHPEMEFVQLQINYLDWESEWVKSRACSEVCVKHGKPRHAGKGAGRSGETVRRSGSVHVCPQLGNSFCGIASQCDAGAFRHEFFRTDEGQYKLHGRLPAADGRGKEGLLPGSGYHQQPDYSPL